MRPAIPCALWESYLHTASLRKVPEVSYHCRRIYKPHSIWPRPVIKRVDPWVDLYDARAMFCISSDFQRYLERETQSMRTTMAYQQKILEARRLDIPVPRTLTPKTTRDTFNLRREQQERRVLAALRKFLKPRREEAPAVTSRVGSSANGSSVAATPPTYTAVLKGDPKDIELNRRKLKSRKDMWASAVSVRQKRQQLTDQRRALQTSRVQNQQPDATTMPRSF
ncbi:hypothetical protein BD626DRAFT_77007 [Schizophyllum amplum]|uniref:Uncharacterized protein n=1 Tax=Schizophyllum amplum TaxID=97359 RepID=A0A550BS62_9AGAR|nr:hypothetical protein BD626DRAFT_77007 [Auriculariopsis ampla]